MLGALLADDGIRNKGVWVALSQSLDFMFSQNTHGSSCQTSNAPKEGLFEGELLSLLTRFGSMSKMRMQNMEAPCFT